MLIVSACVTTEKLWIIDSGATHHVTHDRSLFTELDTYVFHHVNLPTGQSVKIGGAGTIIINTDIVLKNVLYIPEFRLNLLSISALPTDLGSWIIFDSECCLIHDLSKGLMIGRGRWIANLYVLKGEDSVYEDTASLSFVTNSVIDASFWHHRLGHTSFTRLDSLTNVLGISKFKNKGLVHCDICHRAKHKKLPFPTRQNICSTPFELLHIDTWGPFSEPTQDGHRYFLTIVDDHTHVTWIYLLKLKSDVLRVFPSFISMVETQFNAKVKSVRSDNASELCFDDFYSRKGIIA